MKPTRSRSSRSSPRTFPRAVAELLATRRRACRWPMPGGTRRTRSNCATSPAEPGDEDFHRLALHAATDRFPASPTISPLAELVRARDNRSLRRRVHRSTRAPSACSPSWRAAARAADEPDYPADLRCRSNRRTGGLPEIESADVQRLPFGPVRADVVESAEFIFVYVGEHIIHYHPQLFFKHRGMEKRFEGRSLAHGVTSRRAGVRRSGSVAHALAFCQAVEQAAGLRRSAARLDAARRCLPSWSGCTTTSTTSAISATRRRSRSARRRASCWRSAPSRSTAS